MPEVTEEIKAQIRKVYDLACLVEQEDERLLQMIGPLSELTNEQLTWYTRYTDGMVRFTLVVEMGNRGMLEH